MSVLIKGMEMPKCCEECVAGAYEYNDNDERCFVCGFIKSQHPWECEHVEIDGIDTTKARADFCPLIEVPTPHGRLIDADKFKADHSMKNDCAECEKKLQGSSRSCEYDRIYSKMDFCEWIDNAVTVIEAEGENNA